MADVTPPIRTDIPASARIWNHWMGGTDNFEIDRVAGDAAIAIYPDITRSAKQARRFLIRAVRFMAGEAGLRQFLDIGTGLPTMQNTHEVAQSVAPESKVVYVDVEPGFVTTTQWRPGDGDADKEQPADCNCAVARKP